MIYVQHLLGIGHLRRMGFLASVLAEEGFAVDLVSGGFPVADMAMGGVRFHQLPPLKSIDASFLQLAGEGGQLIDEAWRCRRRDTLLMLFDQLTPHALITETFPFGRRMLRFELLPLLDTAQQQAERPVVITSIRDILQPKNKPGRNQEIAQLLGTYYDKVLVHGDRQFADLSATYPFATEISDKTFYTGYIAEPEPAESKSRDGANEVIVSGGGGAVSLSLLRTAIAAKPISVYSNLTWRLLVGHNISDVDFEQLRRSADDNTVVERNRSDFFSLLQHCTLSISQAGYNTVMDILRAKTRAVVVPFSDAGEVEQAIRSDQLARQGILTRLSQSELTAKTLAAAVDNASKRLPQSLEINMNGAQVSARLLRGWLHE